MAAGLGAEVLTIVVGGVEPGTKGMTQSLKRVADTRSADGTDRGRKQREARA